MSDMPDRRKLFPTDDEVQVIVDAYATGRLVDRESIDYEAAYRAAGLVLYHDVRAIVNAAIDAALGANDEE